MSSSTGRSATRVNRIAAATPASCASRVLTSPATGTFAITTRRKRKGAAFFGDALLDAEARGTNVPLRPATRYDAATGVNP